MSKENLTLIARKLKLLEEQKPIPVEYFRIMLVFNNVLDLVDSSELINDKNFSKKVSDLCEYMNRLIQKEGSKSDNIEAFELLFKFSVINHKQKQEGKHLSKDFWEYLNFADHFQRGEA